MPCKLVPVSAIPLFCLRLMVVSLKILNYLSFIIYSLLIFIFNTGVTLLFLIFLNFPGITRVIEKINTTGLEGLTHRLPLDSHIFILRLRAINMSKISSSYLTSSDALLEWKLLHVSLMKWSHHLIPGRRYASYLLNASAFSGLFLAIL